MSYLLLLELLIVVFFLVMFVRGSRLVWGIGLLTVTSATLGNVWIDIFGWEATFDQFGLWSNVFGGLILGGSAVWLLGLLRPTAVVDGGDIAASQLYLPSSEMRAAAEQAVANPAAESLKRRAASMSNESTAYDRQLLFEQIRQNLGPDDILDLIFDLEMVENEVIAPTRDMTQTIVNIMDLAYDRGLMSDLALSVERILTPVPAHHFPRLERLNIESPPTILRRYLLAFYFLTDLEKMCEDLGLDWERMGINSKQAKVRNLLLYLKRHNRLQELLDIMQRDVNNQSAEVIEE